MISKPKAFSYIRFSTPEQLKGDSLRRQLELSQRYAELHGLELDDSLKLRDLGVSAFRGKNITAGALSGFFKAIDSGIVPRGSTLLVESLDRLSRAQMTDALTAFLQIVNAGVTVVTLADQMSYSKESLDQNMGNLFMSLIIMARAHEESATKSKRVAAAWGAKRAKIDQKKLTALGPAWVELAQDRQTFQPIPVRAEIIRRIFQMTLDGHGKRAIAKQFNKEGIETWGRGRLKSNGWHDSYIQKIVTNRAVLGEFQPHIMASGKRQPEGEPIRDYFPRVIDDETFLRITRKPSNSPGPCDNVRTLFTGIAYDGYSGASMHFTNKGTAKRGNGRWQYLVSDHRRLAPDSPTCSWRYSDFEARFLQCLVELDWNQIMRDGDSSELEALRQEIMSLEVESSHAEEVIERLIAALESAAEAPASLVARLADQERRKAHLDEQIENKRSLLSAKTQQEQSVTANTENLKAWAENREDICIRRKLRDAIRRKVKRIDLYPKGLTRTWNEPEEEFILRINVQQKPLFCVTFVNGVIRWVIPIPGQPYSFSIHQITANGKTTWVQDHFGNFKHEEEFTDTVHPPPEIQRLFEPLNADALAG